MTLTLDITPETERSLRAAAERQGRRLEDYAREVLEKDDPLRDLIDHDYLAACRSRTAGTTPPTLEEVRKALAVIPGNLSEDIRAERDER